MKNQNLIFKIGICALFLVKNGFCQFIEHYDGNWNNFGFTSNILIDDLSVVPVKDGTRLVATDVHVYYIGINNKVCDYVWDGNKWVNGMQLEWGPDYVQDNTQICNNGNELFFIRSSDNQICRLYYTTTWQVSVISSIPARAGTDLIYSDNTIYYVGGLGQPASIKNRVCGLILNPTTRLLMWNGALSNTVSFDVLNNSQIIYAGPNQNTTASHVYYIGNDSKVYDIVNQGFWQGSSHYLGYPTSIEKVRMGSELTNNENQLFYTGTNNMLYELHWANGPGWTGSQVMLTQVQPVKNPSQITYFDYHIYFFGANDSKLCDVFFNGTTWYSSQTIGAYQAMNNSKFSVYQGTTGHVVFTIGTDNYVKITLWDDKVCEWDWGRDACWNTTNSHHNDCNGSAQWHNGLLNNTSNQIKTKSNIAIPIDPSNTGAMPKKFFYADLNGYGNVFLRSVTNNIDKPGWWLTFNDEFNDLTITKTEKWVPQGQAHGHAGYGSYGTTDWSANWTESDGIGTIITKYEPNYQGHTWGWSTGPPDEAFCGDLPYDYTTAELLTGGTNVWYDCDMPGAGTGESYCICDDHHGTVSCAKRIVRTCGDIIKQWQDQCYPDFAPPTFQQKYGWFEIRCKVAAGKKMWNAFWAVNKSYWPSEIDFFEIEGNGRMMMSNIYYEDCVIQQPNDEIGNHRFYNYAIGYRYYDDYYTFACEWGPDCIKYYVNNELIGEVCNHYAVALQKDSMFLILNNQVHNDKAQCMPEIFPNNFEIDYVRAYQNPAWIQLRTAPEAKENKKVLYSFSVYPNAVTDWLHIKSDGQFESAAKVIVTNAMGQVVQNTEFHFNNENDFQFDMSAFPAGLYFLSVDVDSFRQSFKMVKL